MTIRIKGNSIRLRLSKPDVEKLCLTGWLEEHTSFASSTFIYVLEAVDSDNDLSADVEDGAIKVFIAKRLIENWSENDRIGFDSILKFTETDSLHLLVEKDFVCTGKTEQSQEDNYQNPSNTCLS